MAFGGDVSVRVVPVPGVKARFTRRCSKLNACVLEPGRIRATEAMSVGLGVVTGNVAL